jgi:hypothetical protein
LWPMMMPECGPRSKRGSAAADGRLTWPRMAPRLKALALQWGCPVAASFDPAGLYSPGQIPLPILEAFQMLPLNYVLSTNTLYLAFGERVDMPPSMPSKKFSTAELFPVWPDGKTSPPSSRRCARVLGPLTLNLLPWPTLARWLESLPAMWLACIRRRCA